MCGYFNGHWGGKRVPVNLLILLGQEIRRGLVQYKQSGCTIECHFRSHRDRWRGNIVCAEHGQHRNEVFGARRIAAEEGVSRAVHTEEIEWPTRQ